MIENANAVCSEMGIEDVEIKLINVANAVEEAELSVNNGADIIITRGYFALLIRKSLECPVVNMLITIQELGMLFHKAKKLLHKKHPVIGICGLRNMFCSTEQFDELFNITVREYFVDQTSDMPSAVDRAMAENVDIIIGGDISCKRAREFSLPCLPLASSKDAIREAFRTTQQMIYVSDLEKKNAAEWAVLLDYSFSGIIRLDAAGAIISLNLPAQNILKKEPAQVIGVSINRLVREITEDILEDVLINGNEHFSIFFTLNNIQIIANFVPILVEGHIHGAVLSCHEVQKIVQISESLRREQYLSGHIAVNNFNQFQPPSPEMKSFISSARLHAKTDASVLITGEPSTEKDVIAQAMHNDGPMQDSPFVTIYCRRPDLKLSNLLFADDSVSGKVDSGLFSGGGTLYLRDIEFMNIENQECLWEFLQRSQQRALSPDAYNRIKIISSTSINLWQKVLTTDFLEDLYYRIAVVSLKLPELRTRKSDVLYWIDYYIGQYCSANSRYVTLTRSAKSLLENYSWTGNLAQLSSFCQSLVANSQSRSVSEEMASNLLEQLYPKQPPNLLADEIYEYPAENLAALLDKHGGNRSLVMKELNISRATLWRRMKKYNISGRYK